MNLGKTLSSVFLVALALSNVKADRAEIVKGSPTSIECNLKFNDSGNALKWYKDGEELTDESKYQKIPANNTLVLLKPENSDGGEYVCSTISQGKQINSSVEVFADAHVEHFARSKNLVQGDNLVIECKAHGYPTPTVSWLKGDLPVSSMDDARISFESNNGIDNDTLKINDLKFEDRAEYTCVATNELGSHNSTILVRVKDKLAALWPFLAICAEVTILCIIIFIYERRRAKKLEEEEMNDTAAHDMTNSNDHKGKDDVRHRKQ